LKQKKRNRGPEKYALARTWGREAPKKNWAERKGKDQTLAVR